MLNPWKVAAAGGCGGSGGACVANIFGSAVIDYDEMGRIERTSSCRVVFGSVFNGCQAKQRQIGVHGCSKQDNILAMVVE